LCSWFFNSLTEKRPKHVIKQNREKNKKKLSIFLQNIFDTIFFNTFFVV
jgi:hypothetical protein